MRILGISAFYHDSAAALVVDGELVAAAQEERFTRKKHDAGFPVQAIKYCLSGRKLRLSDIDAIVFYDKPFLKFERLLETYLAFAPRGFASFLSAIPVWIKDKLFQKKMVLNALREIDPDFDDEGKLHFTEHHQAHAASAFFPSPFEKAVVLTMDGVGEWVTTSAMLGEGSTLRPLKEIRFPHSVGLLYSAFTYYTGFKVNSGEYKVMGLAPYGRPLYVDKILRHLVDLKDDGSFRLNMDYFNYCTGLTMTNARFDALMGGPRRSPESQITQREMDLARSIQEVTEEIMRRLVRSLSKETGVGNFCLAGGVALNCVANGKILREKICENLWIQPAAGDAGGAVGAALATYYALSGKPRKINAADSMAGSYLGPIYSDDEIESDLKKSGAVYEKLACGDMLIRTANELAQEKVIGWVQGRMEFGPRSLGGRSILGDARSRKMQSVMNLKIKYRESFRPFAPAVLAEDVQEYFELPSTSPYMLLVAPVKESRRIKLRAEDEKLFGIDLLNVPKSDIPAVTHVDYSARVQTVHRNTNPLFYGLISEFKKITGSSILVNTSFNVRGEPIVCTAEDAYRCFMRTEMDVLVVGNYVLYKDRQPVFADKGNWQKEFELD